MLKSPEKVIKCGREIRWVQYSLDHRIYKRIVEYVRSEPDYGVLAGDKLEKYKNYLSGLQNRFKIDIPLGSAVSIRNIALKQKIISSHCKMIRDAGVLQSEYDSGADIISISQKFDYTPLGILRLIFKKKYGKKKGKTKRDFRELELAEKYDAESTFNHGLVAKTAAENERLAVEYFAEYNPVDENQLAKEQIIEHGRAVATPDLYFHEPIRINGVDVHWCDFKDYFGTTTSFLFESNKKQTLRYNEIWGTGALLYRWGFTSDLQERLGNHVILISGQSANINFV